MSQRIYFKPILDGDAPISGYAKIGVYRYYENAKEDFSRYNIEAVEITEEDMPLYVIIDDEQEITPTFYVDIPNGLSDEWRSMAEFKTREEAIAFAREKFGADENGMVSLISVS